MCNVMCFSGCVIVRLSVVLWFFVEVYGAYAGVVLLKCGIVRFVVVPLSSMLLQP